MRNAKTPNQAHFPCAQCEYDLYGARVDGACPECGCSVYESASADRLFFSPPRRVRCVRAAVAIWILCSLLLPALLALPATAKPEVVRTEVFGVLRAVGMILLGWGIAGVGRGRLDKLLAWSDGLFGILLLVGFTLSFATGGRSISGAWVPEYVFTAIGLVAPTATFVFLGTVGALVRRERRWMLAVCLVTLGVLEAAWCAVIYVWGPVTVSGPALIAVFLGGVGQVVALGAAFWRISHVIRLRVAFDGRYHDLQAP